MKGKPRGEVRAAAPPASYLHVADDGLEEASKRAAFLLDHSLHFPGAAGTGHALGATALRTGPGSLSPGAVSLRERPTSGSPAVLQRARGARNLLHSAPPKSQSETPSRSGGRVAYVQCSAPGLKNARRRLTIKPPRVPTTEKAKPILVQRKPPADPGPAPFTEKKKKDNVFQIYIFFLKLQNKERENEKRQQQTRSAHVARICCSQTRPPPPFHSCAPGPALALAVLPGMLRGAHARSRPSGAGAREGARSRLVRAPPEGGAGSARWRRGVQGACCKEELARGEASPVCVSGTFRAPLAARVSEWGG